VTPPDLPPSSFYRPLRELLAAVRGGGVFRPTTTEDVKAGKRPPAIHPAGARAGTAAPPPQGLVSSSPCRTRLSRVHNRVCFRSRMSRLGADTVLASARSKQQATRLLAQVHTEQQHILPCAQSGQLSLLPRRRCRPRRRAPSSPVSQRPLRPAARQAMS